MARSAKWKLTNEGSISVFLGGRSIVREKYASKGARVTDSRVKGRIPLGTARLRRPVMLIARNPVSASLLASDSPPMRFLSSRGTSRFTVSSVPDFSRRDTRLCFFRHGSNRDRMSVTDVNLRFLHFRRDENRGTRCLSRPGRGRDATRVPTFRFAYFFRRQDEDIVTRHFPIIVSDYKGYTVLPCRINSGYPSI